MRIASMRKAIANVYNSPRWSNRVARMPDNQVIAIYYRFLEQGRFERVDPKSVSEEKNHQITIFEYLNGIGGQV